MTTKVLGIDPGLSGGMCCIQGLAVVGGIRMPSIKIGSKNVVDAVTAWAWIYSKLPLDLIVVELVGPMPGQGVTSTFAFGRSCGAVDALVQISACPVRYVPPRTWKAWAKVGSAKAESASRASGMFGRAVGDMWWARGAGVDNGIAEAALMAAYGQEKWL